MSQTSVRRVCSPSPSPLAQRRKKVVHALYKCFSIVPAIWLPLRYIHFRCYLISFCILHKVYTENMQQTMIQNEVTENEKRSTEMWMKRTTANKQRKVYMSRASTLEFEYLVSREIVNYTDYTENKPHSKAGSEWRRRKRQGEAAKPHTSNLRDWLCDTHTHRPTDITWPNTKHFSKAQSFSVVLFPLCAALLSLSLTRLSSGWQRQENKQLVFKKVECSFGFLSLPLSHVLFGLLEDTKQHFKCTFFYLYFTHSVIVVLLLLLLLYVMATVFSLFTFGMWRTLFGERFETIFFTPNQKSNIYNDWCDVYAVEGIAWWKLAKNIHRCVAAAVYSHKQVSNLVNWRACCTRNRFNRFEIAPINKFNLIRLFFSCHGRSSPLLLSVGDTINWAV